MHLQELMEKYKNVNDPKYEGIATFNDPRINDRKMNKQLVLEYAKVGTNLDLLTDDIWIYVFQEMSSIPEHGFKLDNFSQLLSNDVFPTLNEIVSNPMTWFGGNESYCASSLG